MNNPHFKNVLTSLMTFALAQLVCLPVGAQVSKEVLESISTPNQVETSIGTLEFLDGAPYPETAAQVCVCGGRMGGVGAVVQGGGGASVGGLL